MPRRYVKRYRARKKGGAMAVAKKALKLARVAKTEVKQFSQTTSTAMDLFDGTATEGALSSGDVSVDHVNAVTGDVLFTNSTGVYYDDGGVDGTFNNIGIWPVSCLAVGDQAYQRNGQEVKIFSVSAKVRFALQLAATYAQCKIILVQDRQPGGALTTPNQADLFIQAGGAYGPLSYRNPLNLKRFKFVAQAQTYISADSVDTKSLTIFHRVKSGKKAEHAPGTANTIASSGYAYYLVAMTNSDISGGATVSYATRMTFTE